MFLILIENCYSSYIVLIISGANPGHHYISGPELIMLPYNVHWKSYRLPRSGIPPQNRILRTKMLNFSNLTQTMTQPRGCMERDITTSNNITTNQ
jgi:hypothetical protein